MYRLVLACVFIFVACKSKHQDATKVESPFSISIQKLDIDTPFSNAFLFNDDIVCVLENGKIAVFDSGYKHKPEIENSLNKNDFHNCVPFVYDNNVLFLLHSENFENSRIVVLDSTYSRNLVAEKALNQIDIDWVMVFSDTICISDKEKVHKILKGFKLESLSLKSFQLLHPYLGREMFEDSVYIISACGGGEFGGRTFFSNKITQKRYSCTLGAVQQVLKHNGSYFLVENLRHLDGYTNYIRVNDPTKLFELNTANMQEIYKYGNFCCNCEISNEADFYSNEDTVKRGVRSENMEIYFDSINLSTIYTFQLDSTIFSIQNTDSLYSIVEHLDTGVRQLDAILRYKASHKVTKIQKVNSVFERLLTSYDYSYSGGDKRKLNVRTTYHVRSGLILINGYTIDILEYNLDVDEMEK